MDLLKCTPRFVAPRSPTCLLRKEIRATIFSCSGFEVQGLTNALKLSSKSLELCGERARFFHLHFFQLLRFQESGDVNQEGGVGGINGKRTRVGVR